MHCTYKLKAQFIIYILKLTSTYQLFAHDQNNTIHN